MSEKNVYKTQKRVKKYIYKTFKKRGNSVGHSQEGALL